MPYRNQDRDIFINDDKLYSNFLRDRGLKSIKHLGKLRLNSLSQEELSDLTILDHVWKTGDKYYKLALRYYGDPQYWWIIAWFNKKPIDNFCKVGDIIHVPTPIEEILYYVGKK